MPRPALLEALAASQAIGAIGPAPLADHIAHARAFAAILSPFRPSRLLDLGSGGGLPGLVLAELLPATALTLLDGRTERGRLLVAAVELLGLRERVDVVAARAEVAGHDAALRHRFDAVVARGFGPPAVTAECAAPLLAEGGILVVSEPPDRNAGERWPAAGVGQLGLELVERRSAPVALAVLRSVRPCGERFPRRIGIPAKRPLF